MLFYQQHVVEKTRQVCNFFWKKKEESIMNYIVIANLNAFRSPKKQNSLDWNM